MKRTAWIPRGTERSFNSTLQPGKPLKRSKGLKSGTPLARTAGPTRRTRVKSKNAKRGGHRFPKGVDEAFRQWVRGHRCVVPGCPQHLPSECAHVKSRGAGGKDLGNCVSLCGFHHAFQHIVGIRSFQAKFGLDLKVIAANLASHYPGGLSGSAGERTHA